MPYDRWIRYEENIGAQQKNLEKLIVTLHCSCLSPYEIKLLRKQRKFLIKHGYLLTLLVRDSFTSDYLNNFELSKSYLKSSDVNFLIFTKKDKGQNLKKELDYILDPTLGCKLTNCVIFDQVSDANNSVPLSLLKKLNGKIDRVEFKTEKNLQESLLSHLNWSVIKLGNDLKKRE